MKPNALAHSPIAHRLDPQVRQAMSRLPVEVVSKLSEAELMALYQSISRPQEHGLDVRLSLPVPSGRMYFVTLAGVERRLRVPQAKSRSPWEAGRFCLAMALTLLAGFTIGGVGYRMINQHAQLVNASDEALLPMEWPGESDATETVNTLTAELHPTVLPWVSDAADCGGFSREWRDGLCYDQAHHPDF